MLICFTTTAIFCNSACWKPAVKCKLQSKNVQPRSASAVLMPLHLKMPSTGISIFDSSWSQETLWIAGNHWRRNESKANATLGKENRLASTSIDDKEEKGCEVCEVRWAKLWPRFADLGISNYPVKVRDILLLHCQLETPANWQRFCFMAFIVSGIGAIGVLNSRAIYHTTTDMLLCKAWTSPLQPPSKNLGDDLGAILKHKHGMHFWRLQVWEDQKRPNQELSSLKPNPILDCPLLMCTHIHLRFGVSFSKRCCDD